MVSQPSVRLTLPSLLNWLSEKQVGEVGYCLTFKDRAAACPNYVGGKGASLALLSSMQVEEVWNKGILDYMIYVYLRMITHK